MYTELYLVSIGFLILEGDNLSNLFPIEEFQVFGLSIGAKKFFVILVAVIILPTIWLDNLSFLSYVSASGVFASGVIILSISWTATFDGIGIHQKELQENLFPSFEDHDRLNERVVTVDIRSTSFSCSCRMFENRGLGGYVQYHFLKILEFLGGYVHYHFLKTIPEQYVLKRWTRDVRPSVDKLKSIINVGTEDTTQAQRYQQICVVTVQLSTQELILSKGIRPDPSSVTPSKSSKVAAVDEPSAGADGFPEPEIIDYNPKDFDFGKKKSFSFRDQVK
ncbi:transmembrane amino acid transporter family protein [Medicago truncatula]|uniref:Protein FAR1-RELATED SEQUENCE n=1 Tax=Medicago truncatula TaxID=3880 RepID=G7JLN4_MEDTR|nr:transmembrane amino acid transporter family protein [Medicago truncatula]KEH32674.1 transmembrane amino acid transporter family protein [Medicago truncatula]